MPDSLIRRRLVVQGRVQGVFFRDSTRRRAESAGVAGWARNRADGAVEVVLEGPPDAVEQMESFVKRGPGDSSVESVQAHDEPPDGLAGFRTR
jgi:acylphosphatase